MFGDDEELEEEQTSEEVEDVDDGDDLDGEEDPDQAPEEEDELRSARKRFDPEESDITHAVDCPLDETCSCGDAEF